MMLHHSEPYTNTTPPPPPPPRDPPKYRITFLQQKSNSNDMKMSRWRGMRMGMLTQTLSRITHTIGTHVDRHFLNRDHPFESNDEVLPPGSESKLGCRLRELLKEHTTRHEGSEEWVKRLVLIVCTDTEPERVQKEDLIAFIRSLGQELYESKRNGLFTRTRMGVLQNQAPVSIQFELVHTGRDISAKAFLEGTGGWIGSDTTPGHLNTTERFDYEEWLENVAVGAIYLRIWETLDV